MPDDETVPAFHDIATDLDYPMVIVTTVGETELAGCLVGFVSQCSVEPPLLMVWMSKRNHTTRVAEVASNLLVHFPSRDERDLAELFGSQTGDDIDKFARCRWEPGPDGLPLLADCTRWVAGHIVERLDSGDHVGHLLDLYDGAAGAWSAQLGFQSVKDLDPGHLP
ncbi:MAG: flavin reductase family protein [Actinomycetota bacterium]|nr:flavin reductase family protein [Actinomycetota bacterium]